MSSTYSRMSPKDNNKNTYMYNMLEGRGHLVLSAFWADSDRVADVVMSFM